MINYQPIQIPLVGGMSTKADPRALQAPALAVAKDCSFDLAGGIQTRPPYAALTNLIVDSAGATTSLSNVRRVTANGDELLVWTKDRLYSYVAARAAVMDRGEHLAVAIDEAPWFETTSDQTQCDRAELGNVVVIAWRDQTLAVGGDGSTPVGHVGPDGRVYVAAYDKVTGAVVMPPTTTGTNEWKPRLVALSTKIMLVTQDATLGDLYSRVLDPAQPLTGLMGLKSTLRTAGASGPNNLCFDVRRLGTSDTAAWACNNAVSNHYTVGTMTAAGSLVSSIIAQTSDGPIAVAPNSDGTDIAVVRFNGATVKTDLYTAGLAAGAFTNQTIVVIAGSPTPITHVTAVRTTGASPERVTAFWCYAENANGFVTSNVDGGYYQAGAASLGRIYGQSIASHAFVYNGAIYLHTVFAQASDSSSSIIGTVSGVIPAQLQNTVFLYRSDGTLHGKALTSRAGGFITPQGHLPSVVATSSTAYAWCANRRRILPLGTDGAAGRAYSARSPVDVLVTFDDDRARRSVRLGETLYITGAEILGYDGEGLREIGFHVYPWRLTFDAGSLAVSPAIPDGSYTWKSSYRWDNAKGERERSTTATVPTVALTGGPNIVTINAPPCNPTHKSDVNAPIVVEFWRTVKDPPDDAPFYLVSSNDPSVTQAHANSFVANAIGQSVVGNGTSFEDNALDGAIALHEQNEEIGAVLENLAPPPATIIAASQSRIFLAGVAGDPHRVWYSKLRDDGRIAAFHDALVIEIPPQGGDITAIALFGDLPYVFREHAIYELPGTGYTNDGGDQNYGPARLVSPDCGALSAEGIATTSIGIIYKSAKGWYLLPPGAQPQYIGAPVADFDGETIVSAVAIEQWHQVRVLTSSRMLVWDYLANQWSEWSNTAHGHGGCIWQGRHAWYSDDTASLNVEQVTPADFSVTGYGLDIETPWIKLNDLAGRGKVRKMLLTGEWRSAHKVQVKTARDYQYTADKTPAWFETKTLTPDSAVVGNRVQLAHGPRYARCEAMKFRITVVSSDGLGGPPVSGECLRLTGLAIEAGVEQGITRSLSAAQKG